MEFKLLELVYKGVDRWTEESGGWQFANVVATFLLSSLLVTGAKNINIQEKGRMFSFTLITIKELWQQWWYSGEKK